jgi:hypothetical protein
MTEENDYFSGIQNYEDKTKEELFNEYFRIDNEIEQEKAKFNKLLFTLESNQKTIKYYINQQKNNNI